MLNRLYGAQALMSENFRGATLMMVCMSAFVLNDAFVRLAGNTLPLAQILFLRGILTTTLLLIFAVFQGSLTSKNLDTAFIVFPESKISSTR